MIHWTAEMLEKHQARIGSGAGRIVRGRDNVGDAEPVKVPKPEKLEQSAKKWKAICKPRSVGEEAMECALRAAHAPSWVAEYRFDSKRRWRADFAFLEAKLLVEVEGGSWTNGRHTRGKGFEDDMEKYNAAVLQGFRVLRFTTAMVEDGRALGVIMQAFSGGV